MRLNKDVGLNDHIVLVGLGRLGRTIAQTVRSASDRPPALVIVDSDPTNPHIQELRDLGIPVIIGDGQSMEVLAQACVADARAVIAVTRSDTVNLSSVLLSVNAARREGRRIRAIAHLYDIKIDRARDALATALPQADPDGPAPVWFNSYEMAAEEVRV